MSVKSIIVVKTGEPVASVRERRGEFADLIRASIGDAWRGPYGVVDVVTSAPPAIDRDAIYVITGSAANVPDRHPWMVRAEAWLREIVAADIPVFGICFGHQILAQALGGEVQRNPRGREMGTMEIERTGDAMIFHGVERRFDAQLTHIDSVVKLPPGAVSLARSALEDHQAIRFTERCYGVQFHPEMDVDVLRSYIETRREILAGEGRDADAMIASLREAPPAKATLQNFIRANL